MTFEETKKELKRLANGEDYGLEHAYSSREGQWFLCRDKYGVFLYGYNWFFSDESFDLAMAGLKQAIRKHKNPREKKWLTQL